jgi:hypothetical protein
VVCQGNQRQITTQNVKTGTKALSCDDRLEALCKFASVGHPAQTNHPAVAAISGQGALWLIRPVKKAHTAVCNAPTASPIF